MDLTADPRVRFQGISCEIRVDYQNGFFPRVYPVFPANYHSTIAPNLSIIMWLGKVSVNTTKVVFQSINIQIESHFIPLHVSVLMGPSSGNIMIVRQKLFELPNTDPYLLQHFYIIKVMPKVGCWGEYLVRREMKWREMGENCIMRSFITCTPRQS
jgi:hypothetical protein